jgi:hypothetical protein
MRRDTRRQGIDRRTFLRLSGCGAAAALAANAAGAEASGVMRVLGRTGMKVAPVGVGAMRTTEPAVLQAAFDRGVNYIDTAHCYMGGKNEEYVGQALKGYRDKVYLATKVHISEDKSAMMKSIEDSLKSLGTDYVDVIQLHSLTNKGQVMHETAREALTAMKEQGKTRFVGLTTHRGEIEVMNAVADDPDALYDTVLVVYNAGHGQDHKDAIARLAAKDVGVIAMKTQQGDYKKTGIEAPPHQAMLRYVLQDNNVALAIPSMVNLDQVIEDTAVLDDLEPTTQEMAALKRYNNGIAPYFCRLCGDCDGACPRGVDVHAMNRSLMYAEGYGDMGLARETVREVPRERSAAVCMDCEQCVVTCSYGLNIGSKMRQARTVLA